MTGPPRYLIGTSGWHYADWRGKLYPPGLPTNRWLEHYAREFPTVELNNPFYRLPTEKAVNTWRETVPEGFLFAVKASRLITHLKRLRDCAEPVRTFFERMGPLGPKHGPVLFQLPPSLHRDKALLDGFLGGLPQGPDHVIEFRHSSWYAEEVFRVLERHRAAFCIHDMRGSETPVLVTANFAYLRLHGPEAKYGGSYSDEQLATWADRLRSQASGCRAVYVYFNNDVGGAAVEDARRLRALIEGGHRPLKR